MPACLLSLVVSASAITKPMPRRSGCREMIDLRRQRLIEKLHALGPRPLGHFINDIERGADIDITLERYARLPREFIAVNGGAEFDRPLAAVAGGRRR